MRDEGETVQEVSTSLGLGASLAHEVSTCPCSDHYPLLGFGIRRCRGKLCEIALKKDSADFPSKTIFIKGSLIKKHR